MYQVNAADGYVDTIDFGGPSTSRLMYSDVIDAILPMRGRCHDRILLRPSPKLSPRPPSGHRWQSPRAPECPSVQSSPPGRQRGKPGRPGPRAVARSAAGTRAPGSNHGRAATERCCPQPRKDRKAGNCQEFLFKSSINHFSKIPFCRTWPLADIFLGFDDK